MGAERLEITCGGTSWEGAGICGEEKVGDMWQNYGKQGENVAERWKDKAGKTMGKTHHS